MVLITGATSGLGRASAHRFSEEGAEGIPVCAVVPESVDTPIFEHAANYTGREVKPVAPVIGPDRTARAIVLCVRRPRAEITIGQVGHGVAIGGGLIPRQLFERTAPKLFEMTALNGHPTDDGPGNLFEPTANRLDGGWRRRMGARAGRGAIVAAATAAMAAGGLIARRARHKRSIPDLEMNRGDDKRWMLRSSCSG